MRALVLNAEHELPKLQEVPPPRPGEHDVLVKVSASGLNYADTMMRRGFYLSKPHFPYIPGFEFSGVVTETGASVREFNPGDRVMGTAESTFAEFVKAPAALLMRVPDLFTDEEAAAFPVNHLTALGMLRIPAHAQRGETILVHAAAGGVGTATIQIAKHLGLRVIATASTEEKLALARKLGADVTINYQTTDFVGPVMEATGKRGADIIFESIGADFLQRNIQAAAPFGRIIVFGMASGTIADPSLGPMFFNSVSVSAFWVFTLLRYPEMLRKIASELLETVKDGKIRPVIGGVYNLDRATEAIQALESRGSHGKLLLKP
jgi:NADPH:quinone reductase